MLKGKNLLIIAGVAAVGYYLWKKNQAAKVIAPPATSDANFTGDLNVPEYQNAEGDINLSDRQWNRLSRISQNNPARAQRVANRMVGRSR